MGTARPSHTAFLLLVLFSFCRQGVWVPPGAGSVSVQEWKVLGLWEGTPLSRRPFGVCQTSTSIQRGHVQEVLNTTFLLCSQSAGKPNVRVFLIDGVNSPVSYKAVCLRTVVGNVLGRSINRWRCVSFGGKKTPPSGTEFQ